MSGCSGSALQGDDKMQRILLIVLFSVFIAGCGVSGRSGSAERDMDPASILNKTWQWVETTAPDETIIVSNPDRYTFFLTEAGEVQAQFDCNKGGGSYEISEGKLSFGPMMSTRMACPEDSLDMPFMRDLDKVASFSIEDGDLYLELDADGGTMHFRPAP
jgi:heat shock protein HslJ